MKEHSNAKNLAERSRSVLQAILAGADPVSWYSEAPKVKSAWEPFDLCDLRGSDLSNRKIGKVMLAECDLDEADFSYASLDETALQSTSVSRAKFTNAKLHRTQMIPFFGQKVDFRGAIFKQAFIQYAKLFNSVFDSATLEDVSLSHADVSGSSFVGAQFTASSLDSAVLRETDLTTVSFNDCNLIWAVFQHAQMSGVTLRNCDMSGADFRGANLKQAQLRGGKFGVVQQGDAFTPTRFDDTPETRKLILKSGAQGIESIEWHAAGSLLEQQPKRLIAGEASSRSGFWFTPARTNSRKFFEAGEVMPEAGGDYGTTFWQWDSNQEPPKL